MEHNIVIVEDEKNSLDALTHLLSEYCEAVNILGTAGTVKESVALIKKVQPDLVFLDVELHSGTGFDVLRQVQEVSFEVIFTTAYEQYAINAIKFSSVDYLLKPIDLDELQEALEKVKKRKGNEAHITQIKNLLMNLQEKNISDKKICLSTLQGIEFVKVVDIVYCKANGSYTLFSIKGQNNQLVSKNLKEFENLLEEFGFMRVHNSYLINLREVKKYIKSEGGYIIMSNNDHVHLSSRKKDIFLERIMALGNL
ncbi:LytR/AlgR family response regulator transcription factor [Marinirhabdus gelatinilytica]|uniref:LytTR family two component transcriptional regulator n=1 Tax=Marinirhabdus gelatinilytica TaxID=1703343 RepID=A0A370QG55_9FLAO|nr:LytTR family DNA-binding domain-containing protein [Marinirhabdus gelatinilytica]RDK87346.1 LytTR family two component transcriptional regulator [Marinirhabdus gelatinilytica]